MENPVRDGCVPEFGLDHQAGAGGLLNPAEGIFKKQNHPGHLKRTGGGTGTTADKHQEEEGPLGQGRPGVIIGAGKTGGGTDRNRLEKAMPDSDGRGKAHTGYKGVSDERRSGKNNYTIPFKLRGGEGPLQAFSPEKAVIQGEINP